MAVLNLVGYTKVGRNNMPRLITPDLLVLKAKVKFRAEKKQLWKDVVISSVRGGGFFALADEIVERF